MSHSHEGEHGTAVSGRRAPIDPTPPESAARSDARPDVVARAGHGEDEGQRRTGVRDIVGGLFLIGVGFMWGSSVYLGNPTAIDWVFDALGTFWVCKGLYQIFAA